MIDDWDEEVSRAYGNIARREREQFAEPPIENDETFDDPLGDFVPRRDRRPHHVPCRAAPKLDTPIPSWDQIDQRIAQAIEAALQYVDESSTEALKATNSFAEAVENSNADLRDQLRDLKIEVAKLASINAELRAELAEARSQATSTGLLPRRLPAH
jgi:hypothetical protein